MVQAFYLLGECFRFEAPFSLRDVVLSAVFSPDSLLEEHVQNPRYPHVRLLLLQKICQVTIYEIYTRYTTWFVLAPVLRQPSFAEKNWRPLHSSTTSCCHRILFRIVSQIYALSIIFVSSVKLQRKCQILKPFVHSVCGRDLIIPFFATQGSNSFTLHYLLF